MAVKTINGIHLEQMLRNGLSNLIKHEEEVNRLNVFPVPDGDTGTNMRMTLQHGLENAGRNADVGEYLKSLSGGMLLGARGNSGVILSQFFNGFAYELSRCSLIGPGELRAGLLKGYRVAYRAVVTPVEGTILSVAREGIEHIRNQITRSSSIDSILAMYVAEMKKTLTYTPEMLSVLKEAGVVDSGAYGFILIFEGMLKYLYGEVIDPGENARETEKTESKAIDFSLFNENSAFTDGYCMEFILQLMRASSYDQNFDLNRFIGLLKKAGNSLVCVQDGKRVKVHIHTKNPAGIIHLARKYGEFLTFKLENMQLQHNEHDRDVEEHKKEHKPLSIISVVDGEGLKKLFKDLGCDVVIDVGEKMNASAKDFVSAFDKTDADAILVLPNNKNAVLAAEQAAALAKDRNVTVVPSESFAEGYFALAMDLRDADAGLRVNQIKRGIDGVVTLSETTASRDYSYHEISCRKGEQIVLRNGELVGVSSDWKKAVSDAYKLISSDGGKETCVVFRGYGVPEEYEEELYEALAKIDPMLEIEFIDGGQHIYQWVIGIL